MSDSIVVRWATRVVGAVAPSAWLVGVATACLFGIAQPTPAASAPLRTFYVDVGGNDAADGSAGSPWKTRSGQPVPCALATW